ncbi:BRCT domain-containing protein [Stenotrophomonas sp. MMGLT7]|uniref:BRCT domain-containing protein n=1 Tax=Stenotrophomonas sp. MMGLT7 TaxID=2901227 RepID=UPI001E301613|nr:BRCT domain-containing protein [Stenotrophomonas sp. MMGLT7]MCD7096969.1 BRCT domain-containing protein [Stenotrophomonas sp. MMGLT7]
MFFRSDNGAAPAPGITHGRRKDRTTDELIGLVRGLLADGMVVQQEAQFLARWLEDKREFLGSYPFDILYSRLSDALVDGVLDEDESNDLADLFLRLSSNENATVEAVVAGKASSSLPITRPEPVIVFPEQVFVVTGVFDFGNRKQVTACIQERGGRVSSSISGLTNYLVVGNQGSDDWMHSSFGRKIEAAIDHGVHVVIESHWHAHL